MTIKIPPYPNYKISLNALESVKSNSIQKNESSGLSSQLVFVAEFKDGEKKVFRSRPVKNNGRIYISSFPNPVHLFLSAGIEHFSRSEEIKNKNFPKCGKKMGEDIFLLDIESSGTHQCHNDYIKDRCSSIVMLVSSIEAFLNHIIPNDFVYHTIRKNKPVVFDKVGIESPKVSFNEKLENVIPQVLELTEFWETLSKELADLTKLYNTRKQIIHLKTNAEDDFNAYFNEMDEMLDLDIDSIIKSIVNFMNTARENFIEFK